MTLMIDDTSAILIIDVQKDFCPGGALAVEEGHEVAAVINGIQDRFPLRVLTQDWHPADHMSFADNQGAEPFSVTEVHYGEQVMWPRHCVQGSEGAAFHEDLDTDRADLVIRKGMRPEIDSYSAFFENDRTTRTGLSGYLKDRSIETVYVTGLATDFCVYYSATDAIKEGFAVVLVTDACRHIDLDGSLAAAMADMKEKGVKFVTSDEL
ncbi:MAG: nicotinamidase [Rhizobiaceae bacterium MnEN-MB40S]|nr:MAG: nicotinamidase [Rhizobiaceae bacterium MnEN-MB40S]